MKRLGAGDTDKMSLREGYKDGAGGVEKSASYLGFRVWLLWVWVQGRRAIAPDGDDQRVGHEVEQAAVKAHVALEHVQAAELQRGGAEGAREGCRELFAGGNAQQLAQHVDFFLVCVLLLLLLLLLLLTRLIQRHLHVIPTSEQPACKRRHERRGLTRRRQHAPAAAAARRLGGGCSAVRRLRLRGGRLVGLLLQKGVKTGKMGCRQNRFSL
jgi:hypothetical protein